MKNKFFKISAIALGSIAGVSAFTLPIVSCSTNTILGAEQLTQLWKDVNKYVASKKVTVATDTNDENWSQHIKGITNVIKKLKLSDGSLLSDYANKITLTRKLANISFKLDTNNLKIQPMSLYDGYIVLLEDGTVNLNNLALSSPESYFVYENGNPNSIIGLTEKGKLEPDLLIPYNTKTINGHNSFNWNNSLRNVIMPDTLTEVNTTLGLFKVDKNLEYVKLSRNLRTISDEMFMFSGLKKIDWYEGLENIGKYAFYKTSLEGDLILPKSVKIIDDHAFGYIKTNLTSITAWTSDLRINVFEFIDNLKQINLIFDTKEVGFINQNAFWRIPEKATVQVKNAEIKRLLEKICITNNPKPEDRINPNQIVVNPNLQ